MRGAYLRALNHNVVEFKLHQCNSCGVDNDNIGEYIIVESSSTRIKIWNCQRCLDDEEKERQKILI